MKAHPSPLHSVLYPALQRRWLRSLIRLANAAAQLADAQARRKESSSATHSAVLKRLLSPLRDGISPGRMKSSQLSSLVVRDFVTGGYYENVHIFFQYPFHDHLLS